MLATPIVLTRNEFAQLKAAIDRFYSFSSPLREKKVVLLAACADGEGSMDALLAHYEIFSRFLHWEDAGRVLAYNCWVEDGNRPSCAQAYELGKSL